MVHILAIYDKVNICDETQFIMTRIMQLQVMKKGAPEVMNPMIKLTVKSLI